MDGCIFCKIAEKKLDSQIIHEDSEVIAFEDVNPQAPVHILIVPKKHIIDLLHFSSTDEGLIGKIHSVAKKIAKERKIEKGFRIICNCGEEAGESVGHLHFHLLGGRRLEWPPG